MIWEFGAFLGCGRRERSRNPTVRAVILHFKIHVLNTNTKLAFFFRIFIPLKLALLLLLLFFVPLKQSTEPIKLYIVQSRVVSQPRFMYRVRAMALVSVEIIYFLN